MSEMVERVMGVLDAQLDFLLETGHLRLGPAYKADSWLLREMAVAAIEAMREPTGDMYEAIYRTEADKDEFANKARWQAMIDEALK